MKISTISILASLFLLTASTQAHAMGQTAQVFETSKGAGIWSHPSQFFLRFDLAELADLKDQTFLWAGFTEESSKVFKGEVVADQFGKNERRFVARAKLLETTESASYYRIEIFGESGKLIKEVFLKGPIQHSLPTE